VICIQISENEAVGTCKPHEKRRKAFSNLVEKSEINRPLEVLLVVGKGILKGFLRLRWEGVE
jgi:hypothetical protein